jgi:hypothetical protein
LASGRSSDYSAGRKNRAKTVHFDAEFSYHFFAPDPANASHTFGFSIFPLFMLSK